MVLKWTMLIIDIMLGVETPISTPLAWSIDLYGMGINPRDRSVDNTPDFQNFKGPKFAMANHSFTLVFTLFNIHSSLD